MKKTVHEGKPPGHGCGLSKRITGLTAPIRIQRAETRVTRPFYNVGRRPRSRTWGAWEQWDGPGCERRRTDLIP